jgi:hypothetical protein
MPMRNKLQLLAIFLVSISIVAAPEGWDNFTGTDNNYSRKLITLGLFPNYINVKKAKPQNGSEVLVFISDNPESDFYFKTLCEALCNDLSLIEYVTNRRYYADKEQYEKERLRYYLRGRNQAAMWPPVFWEPKEIEIELNKSDFTKKHLLISGFQTAFLIEASMQNNYNSIILVSPDISLLSIDNTSFQEQNLLWVGGQSEENKLNLLQKKFGGNILTYSKSSAGRHLLMRNIQVLNDILDWIKKAG